jgi:16S rRNA (guanine527-N7)-methyltransferase
MTISHLLRQALKENLIMIDDKAQQTLLHYLTLMQQWNRAFNLTAITDERSMVYLHLIDSLMILPYLEGHRFLDVGAGAGLPGIPLAIAQPQHHWTLLDKNRKKTQFMTQATVELGLKNIEVQHARCEEFQPHFPFDMIVSRAFGSLRLFAETAAQQLTSQGMLLAMKGKFPQDELNDIPSHVEVKDVIRLTIAGMEAERHLIRLRKK